EPILRRALALAEEALGPRDVEVGLLLNQLGILHKYQGRFAEAGPIYPQALWVIEPAPGPHHPQVASIYPNLRRPPPRARRAAPLSPPARGGRARPRARRARGPPLPRRSVAIREAALGPDHPDVAADVAALAAIVAERGRLDEAEALYLRALAVFERVH